MRLAVGHAAIRAVTPRHVTRRRAGAGLLASLLLAVTLATPTPAGALTTWSRNLFVGSGWVYQDPYFAACTAAATMSMLNTVALRGTGGQGFGWTPYRVLNNRADPTDPRDLTSIFAFERARDTLGSSSAGSDAHGWRNALNYFGWGTTAMTEPSKMVYVDRAYATFDAAVKAAVRAMATFGMPVGVLGWAGGHAQVLTGYVASGQDPRLSSAFTVQAVYLSDPLRSNRFLNLKISLAALRTGNVHYRFQAYRETDSPYRDTLTGGVLRAATPPTKGASEWYHRWVLVLPVRAGIPGAAPAPSATPEPNPATTPEASPTPTPDISPATTPTPDASSPPTPDATTPPGTTPTPTPGTTATPDAPTTATPSSETTPDATPSAEPATPGATPGATPVPDATATAEPGSPGATTVPDPATPAPDAAPSPTPDPTATRPPADASTPAPTHPPTPGPGPTGSPPMALTGARTG